MSRTRRILASVALVVASLFTVGAVVAPAASAGGEGEYCC